MAQTYSNITDRQELSARVSSKSTVRKGRVLEYVFTVAAVFSARSAAVLGSSNVSVLKEPEL